MKKPRHSDGAESAAQVAVTLPNRSARLQAELCEKSRGRLEWGDEVQPAELDVSDYLLAAIDLLLTIAFVLGFYAAVRQVKKTQLAFPVKFLIAAVLCAVLIATSLGVSGVLGHPGPRVLLKILPNPQAPAPNPPKD